MTSNDFIRAIADFNLRVSNDTIEQCPISIDSVSSIYGEDAELVRFSYGRYKESCVAVFYSDGTFFTPYDWSGREWDEEEWKIEDTRWVDGRCVEATMLNGMPRVFV